MIIEGESTELIFNDFAGQDVLRALLQFYLKTMSTVFVVFDASDMIKGPEAEAKCIKEILSWINLVIAQTFDSQSRKMASIVLVGTHLDVIANHARKVAGAAAAVTPEEAGPTVDAILETVSLRLHAELKDSFAWPYVIPNEHGRNGDGARTQTNFFCVDCTKGRGDRDLRLLMRLIERKVGSSPVKLIECCDEMRCGRWDGCC
jgi:hypothetical protein